MQAYEGCIAHLTSVWAERGGGVQDERSGNMTRCMTSADYIRHSWEIQEQTWRWNEPSSSHYSALISRLMSTAETDAPALPYETAPPWRSNGDHSPLAATRHLENRVAGMLRPGVCLPSNLSLAGAKSWGGGSRCLTREQECPLTGHDEIYRFG